LGLMEPTEERSLGEPRLVITHLELENFKSYAGVQRIGPFHKARTRSVCIRNRGGATGGMRAQRDAHVYVRVCGYV
jgi:hypothetical protein